MRECAVPVVPGRMLTTVRCRLAVDYLFLADSGAGPHPPLEIEAFDAAHEQNDYEVRTRSRRVCPADDRRTDPVGAARPRRGRADRTAVRRAARVVRRVAAEDGGAARREAQAGADPPARGCARGGRRGAGEQAVRREIVEFAWRRRIYPERRARSIYTHVQ
jgi:hypothetical protein